MAYGPLPQGFAIKPLAAILSSMQQRQLQGISASLNLQPPDPLAVNTGIVAQELFEAWQAIGAVYNGMDPDQATGDQETSLALITGVLRGGAEPTVAPSCVVNVDNNFFAAAGTMFASATGAPQVLFTNATDVQNVSGIPANETVDFVCTQTGPIALNTSTLTVIAGPLSGWNTITNPVTSVLGQDIENDANLRIARQQSLAASGSTTAAAIRADVLGKLQLSSNPLTIAGIGNTSASFTHGNPFTLTVDTLSCTVLWNDGDVTDGDGLPPHSIEVIAYAPGAAAVDNSALASLILADKAAGIQTNGTAAVTVYDSQGISESINYTRPQATAVTCTITVTARSGSTTLEVQDAVLAALQLYTGGPSGANGAWQPGAEVYYQHTLASAFQAQGVTILDVTSFHLNGGTVNIVIDVRHIATLSMASGDVTVNFV